MKTIYFLLIALFFLSACNNNSKKSEAEDKEKDSVLHEQDTILKDTSITDLTQIILKHIKNKDYQSLTQYIHPELGIRFTPYSYINLKEDITIKADQFTKMINNDEKLLWGLYDGTGEEIKLTTRDYFAKFVYDVDFLKAPKLTVNESSAAGNSINNIKEIYPDADYTESYFSGFKKEYGGMDWRALRLVYKKADGKYYLIGIIHDQWTV